MDMYSVSVGNATMSLRNSDPYQATITAFKLNNSYHVNAFQLNNVGMQMAIDSKSEPSLEDVHNRANTPEISETKGIHRSALQTDPDAMDEDIHLPTRRQIEITDYSTLNYPTTMFPGKKDFRRGKSFEQQLIHPNAFCTILDEKNPNVLLNLEQYHAAWSYAVDLAWDNGKLDLENCLTVHQGKHEWEMDWHFIHEKHVTMRSIRNKDIQTFQQRQEIRQKVEEEMEEILAGEWQYGDAKEERARAVYERFNLAGTFMHHSLEGAYIGQ